MTIMFSRLTESVTETAPRNVMLTTTVIKEPCLSLAVKTSYYYNNHVDDLHNQTCHIVIVRSTGNEAYFFLSRNQ